jgi:hypothetical protein
MGDAASGGDDSLAEAGGQTSLAKLTADRREVSLEPRAATIDPPFARNHAGEHQGQRSTRPYLDSDYRFSWGVRV